VTVKVNLLSSRLVGKDDPVKSQVSVHLGDFVAAFAKKKNCSNQFIPGAELFSIPLSQIPTIRRRHLK
jgi:hypothetical protein